MVTQRCMNCTVQHLIVRCRSHSYHQMLPYTGDSIASCSGDKTVRVWQRHGTTDTWVCAAILEETHHRSIRCSSWSPDGRYLATASFDATTAIWEVQASSAPPNTACYTRLHATGLHCCLANCRAARGSRLPCLKAMKAK